MHANECLFAFGLGRAASVRQEESVNAPLRHWMIEPLLTISPKTRLEDAAQRMRQAGISALPVVDAGRPLGVISRTDLLQAGRVTVQEGPRRRALTLPDANVDEFMHNEVVTLGEDASITECARVMVKEHMHRVYVEADGKLVGVVGTREMMAAVIQAQVRVPLREMLHGSLVSVKAEEPVRLAIDRLAAAHRSGLVVMDGEWPVGVFSQAEALAAREAPADDHVDRWMSSSVLCLPVGVPVYRAAQQAYATEVRRLLGIDGNEVRGILSGLDFAQIVKSNG